MTDFNPMNSVDINAIEEKMKAAALDQHRGYAQNHYGEVQQYRSTEYVPKSSACGYQVLREPAWNKGQSRPSPSLLLSFFAFPFLPSSP